MYVMSIVSQTPLEVQSSSSALTTLQQPQQSSQPQNNTSASITSTETSGIVSPRKNDNNASNAPTSVTPGTHFIVRYSIKY